MLFTTRGFSIYLDDWRTAYLEERGYEKGSHDNRYLAMGIYTHLIPNLNTSSDVLNTAPPPTCFFPMQDLVPEEPHTPKKQKTNEYSLKSPIVLQIADVVS